MKQRAKYFFAGLAMAGLATSAAAERITGEEASKLISIGNPIHVDAYDQKDGQHEYHLLIAVPSTGTYMCWVEGSPFSDELSAYCVGNSAQTPRP